MRKIAASLAVLALSSPAFAVVDLTAIGDAKTDMLAVIGAMLGLGVAVWGGLKVVRMFKG